MTGDGVSARVCNTHAAAVDARDAAAAVEPRARTRENPQGPVHHLVSYIHFIYVILYSILYAVP